MNDIFQGLNTRQREAVEATEGRIRVVAGANKDYTSFEVEFDSGSTRTLRAGFLKQSDLPE